MNFTYDFLIPGYRELNICGDFLIPDIHIQKSIIKHVMTNGAVDDAHDDKQPHPVDDVWFETAEKL